jgi:hypothetical protein
MATSKFIGEDDVSCSWSNWNNYAVWDRFICSITGRCTEIHIKLNGSCEVKVALYADNSGTPGTLLAKKDAGTSCVAGWNTILFESPCDLISGIKYWLAIACNMTSNYAGYLTQTSDGHKLKSITYSSWTWVANPPDLITNNAYISMLAGWGILVLAPAGISQPVSYGLPKLNISFKLFGLAQPQSVGAPAVVTSAPIIYAPGIAQVVGVGAPALIYLQVIAPSGLVQSAAIGIPSTGIVETLSPQGISVIVSCGRPTLLKYVWHVILDGRYSVESPEKNRIYIIGRDQYGNPVYGTALDYTELGLVGERLDFQQELAIPTAGQAESMAGAILSKMRLTGKRGVILIPPNCGQELFDVVQISDSGANQQAVSFRVIGIRFEFSPRKAYCYHQFILGCI